MLRTLVGTILGGMLLVTALPAQEPADQGQADSAPSPRWHQGRHHRSQAIERWRRMPPEERQKALEKLPPERRQRIEEQLQRLDRMPADQRRGLERRYERFQSLPPEQQERVRQVYRRMRELPPERRMAINHAARHISTLPDAERKARMESEEFRGRFSPEEREMVGELVAAMPAI